MSVIDTSQSTLTMPVMGMSCAACQSHIEKTLRQTPGVVEASVNLMNHNARIVFDPALIEPEGLVAAVQSAGYDATLPPTTVTGDPQGHTPEERGLKLRAFTTLAFAGAATLLSMPLMHATNFLARAIMRLLPAMQHVPSLPLEVVLLALTLIGMFWAAGDIYRAAWNAAVHRTTNMNTLVALGTGAAFLYSAFATAAPSVLLRHGIQPEVYYESVLFILAFLLLGRWLEERAKTRTQDALRLFSSLLPQTARVVSANGLEEDVPLAQVRSGDLIVLRPGERVAVDGVVESGSSSVDESLITGESLPVLRTKGDRLIGGSLNFDGALEYRATSLGADSVLGQMVRIMREAQSSRAPTQQLADRVSSFFVPAVLVLAALAFVLWVAFAHGDFARAFAVSITVLVIACPCAMGLAVPAALTVAIGRGAQFGVLFKSGEAVERLARIDTIVFDKTGTLTEGKPRISAIYPANGIGEDGLLRLAASLEQRSEHPLARAVIERAFEARIQILPVADLRALPGKGITGVVDDRAVAAGNHALFSELGVAAPPAAELPSGTALLIAVDREYRGCLIAEDAIRPGVYEVINLLHRSGYQTMMLTGDSDGAARSIANQTGITEVFSSLLPEQKLAKIRELQARGKRVAMIGDGINDAAALAQADAGLAVGTGTDLAREAGDAILLRGEPRSILDALSLARRTLHTMRTNLGWALAYNVVGIPIAAGVLYPLFGILLSPAIASAAMALSSVSVLANSLRLRRFRTA